MKNRYAILEELGVYEKSSMVPMKDGESSAR